MDRQRQVKQNRNLQKTTTLYNGLKKICIYEKKDSTRNDIVYSSKMSFVVIIIQLSLLSWPLYSHRRGWALWCRCLCWYWWCHCALVQAWMYLLSYNWRDPLVCLLRTVVHPSYVNLRLYNGRLVRVLQHTEAVTRPKVQQLEMKRLNENWYSNLECIVNPVARCLLRHLPILYKILKKNEYKPQIICYEAIF